MSPMPDGFAALWSADREAQHDAFVHFMALTDAPVDWSYDAWDELLAQLTFSDNHNRAIAGQLLCNLAKSDPEGRIVRDFDRLFAVSRDERFVTARHTMQQVWKVGLAGEAQRRLLLAGLEARFAEAGAEKSGTLVRNDICVGLRRLYDDSRDPAVKALALRLIETETDPGHRKRYAAAWRGA